MKIVDFNNGINIKIPNDWRSEDDDGTVSLYDADNGFGALQLSFYSIDSTSSVAISKELESYLEDRHEDIIVKTINDYAYSSIEDEDGIYWRYWFFFKNAIAHFGASLVFGP